MDSDVSKFSSSSTTAIVATTAPLSSIPCEEPYSARANENKKSPQLAAARAPPVTGPFIIQSTREGAEEFLVSPLRPTPRAQNAARLSRDHQSARAQQIEPLIT